MVGFINLYKLEMKYIYMDFKLYIIDPFAIIDQNYAIIA
jgi:hypothetical protein